MKKTVVLGISGGIAALKILDLAAILKKKGINLEIIMTHGATRMVNPEKFAQLTGKKVYTDIFAKEIAYSNILKTRKIEHIEIAKKADLIVIAPATANIMAKIANGIADDYLTTTILAARSNVLICPSMNSFMWSNPITQANRQKLESSGYIILDPDSGLLACGDEGTGRLVQPSVIAEEIFKLLENSDLLKGKKVIVTAGGTHEYIDQVRFIANKSSGKMGACLAEAAFLSGAEVLLVRSVDSVKPAYPVQEVMFETSEDLQKILFKEIPKFDFCIHAAAVSDFNPVETKQGKLDSDTGFTLELKPAEKILNKIKKLNPKIILVGFKAVWGNETDQIESASKKLKESQSDYIVVNDVGKKDRGFSVDDNEVIILSKKGEFKKFPLSSKRTIARKIIEYIATAFYEKNS